MGDGVEFWKWFCCGVGGGVDVVDCDFGVVCGDDVYVVAIRVGVGDFSGEGFV